ncbi:MAG TPA: hypothetical protein VGL08_10580 [Paraburkholderia sp.]|jgi:hypothetical protein
MSNGNFISKLDEFMPLWKRANAGVQTCACSTPQTLLYFDAIDIATQRFFEFIRSLLAFEGARTFAVLALQPDPFSYFYHHFKKYPAFIVGPENSDNEFFAFLHADPGDSPADALAYNAQRYAILPSTDSWFIYGNWSKQMSALCGSADAIAFAREHYPFFLDPGENFKIVD